MRAAKVLAGFTWLICATATAQDGISDELLRNARQLQELGRQDQRAYALVESLVTEVGPRFAGSPGDARAVEWALRKLAELGFERVRAEPVTVPRWERGEIRIELRAPHRQGLEAVALGGSVATPPAGLEADVVAVGSQEELESLPDEAVKDKIVFFNTRMERTRDGAGYGKAVVTRSKGPAQAARKGAAAVVIRSIGTDQHRFGHTGTTTYEKDQRKIPAAALSAADADLLERALKSGAVRLYMKLSAKDGGEASSANVIGEIPGETNEIVLLAAHLDSWDITPGANDDAAGVGIVMAAARLIPSSGRKPRCTLRVVLYADEEFGLAGAKAYAEAHASELDRHVLAMEADFGSGPVFRLDAGLPPERWPLLAPLARELGFELGANDSKGGADVGVLHKIGVPVLHPKQDGSVYFDVHHTLDDTLDKIDRTGLAQNVGAYAALAYVASEYAPAFGRVAIAEPPAGVFHGGQPSPEQSVRSR